MQPASGTERPWGFNQSVYLDLKYHHDIRNKVFVSLSVVDAGTSYHVASLLKTRRAAYVARKFITQWVNHYGAPLEITTDQGGEFCAEFQAVLEEHCMVRG